MEFVITLKYLLQIVTMFTFDVCQILVNHFCNIYIKIQDHETL